MLLHTKLTVPLVRSCLVVRPRLTAELEQDMGGCLTLVSAPAGFGKTTLIAEWAGQRSGRVAWLSLDEGDNDLVRFWRYVIAALHTVAEKISQESMPGLEVVTSSDWEKLVTRLINEITAAASATAPVTLVLDDYHLIHINEIHQSLNFLLYHQPHQLHVIILTRADPPLALARLRVQGRLMELRAADLQFTPAETQAFFDCALEVNLLPEALSTLSGRIEGWAAGLQLAALSLKGLSEAEIEPFIQTFSGAQRYVLNYLLEEVLQRQPEHIQSFLLQTAFLRPLNPSLCAAVTGYEDARHILARLADENLFISPLDEAGGWYRYHPLFADALRKRLEQTEPEIISELRRRAAAWYAKQGTDNDIGWFDSLSLDPLTGRELEILSLIAQGLSNQQIAERLVISVGTVKGHINHLLSKMDAHNRTEAVAQARRLGLLKT